MENDLHRFIKTLPTTPFLFVGAGLSRRYYSLPSWQALITIFIDKITDGDPVGWAKYFQSYGPDYAQIASIVEQEFNKKWFDTPSVRTLSSEMMEAVTKENCSPFKAEIASFIISHSQINTQYEKEIETLKGLTERNIAGFITTNYDSFLEDIAPGYVSYVGQEELLFSSIQNIAEIYKIHGSVANPNSIVITAADYQDFDAKASYLSAKLLTIFLENPIIFIGYSITDSNIRKIITSIVHCLSSKNASKLSNRFIFIEHTSEYTPPKVASHTMDIDGQLIPMTKIRLYDYSNLYEALSVIHSALPAKLLRMFKDEFYHYVLNGVSTQNLYVAGINDKRVSDQKLVLAIASPDQLGPKGLSGIEANEIYKDIVLETIHNTADEILTYAYPKLIKQSTKLPVFKYLKSAAQLYPTILEKTNIHCLDDLLSKTIKDNRDKKDSGLHSIHELIVGLNYTNLYALNKVNLEICFLDELEIDVNELYRHLVSCLKENPNIFSNETKQGIKTNLRRLIRVYDWLKYGKE